MKGKEWGAPVAMKTIVLGTEEGAGRSLNGSAAPSPALVSQQLQGRKMFLGHSI